MIEKEKNSTLVNAYWKPPMYKNVFNTYMRKAHLNPPRTYNVIVRLKFTWKSYLSPWQFCAKKRTWGDPCHGMGVGGGEGITFWLNRWKLTMLPGQHSRRVSVLSPGLSQCGISLHGNVTVNKTCSLSRLACAGLQKFSHEKTISWDRRVSWWALCTLSGGFSEVCCFQNHPLGGPQYTFSVHLHMTDLTTALPQPHRGTLVDRAKPSIFRNYGI